MSPRVRWLAAAALLLPLGQEPNQAHSWLAEGRLHLRSEGATTVWDGPAGADTYCWDKGGRAVVVTRAGRMARVHADGRRETLARGFAALRFPDACPADGRIAFACTLDDPTGSNWQLRVIEWDGRGNLELGPGYDPSFVPDGSAVVFEAFDEHGPDLWVYTFEDRSRRRLLEGTPRLRRYTPAVSPDGRQVAFTSDGRLFLVGLDGAGLREWSPPEGVYDRFASFGADGASILFVRDRAGESQVIWRDARGAEHALNCGEHPLLPTFRPARDGLLHRELTPEQAGQLVESAGSADLALPDLERLDADTARALAGARGCLRLDGLTSIDESVALALAEWDSVGEHVYLALDGLRRPSPAVLAALARVRGWGLSLGGLRELSPEAASALCGFRGARLRLRGLLRLDPAAAVEFAARGQAKWLELDYETEIPSAARSALAQGRTELIVP